MNENKSSGIAVFVITLSDPRAVSSWYPKVLLNNLGAKETQETVKATAVAAIAEAPPECAWKKF